MGIASRIAAAAGGGAAMPPPPSAWAAPIPERAGGMSASDIRAKLISCIRENGLASIFPEAKLASIVDRLVRVDWGCIAAAWRLPIEVVKDFCMLALYDSEWERHVALRQLETIVCTYHRHDAFRCSHLLRR